MGGNWTPKVDQVSGNSEGMSSCLEDQNLKQPCKMWPGRATSAAGLVCRRAPWPAHQSSCPGALASSARCWLPGAPSCGSFIHIIVSNLLMQAVCKYKKGATWVHIEIHLSPPDCCCLPRRDVAALLLSLNKSSTCVCDRSFLFQNTDTVGCLFC